jgi:hypothetical protein
MKTRRSVWEKPKVTNVIAEREFHLVTKGGRKRKVVARFGKPRPFPEGKDVYCVFELTGLEGEIHELATKPTVVPGVDSVQALYGAMQMAWFVLFASPAYREGRLSYFGMVDLGLPPLVALAEELGKEPRRRKGRR